MKKFLLVSILFLLVACQASFDKKGVEDVLYKQETAWNAGDIEGFMEGYLKSDSLMFISKKGVSYGWQKVLDNYRKSYPDKAAMGTLKFELLQVKALSPNTAMVVGKWELSETDKKAGGHFQLILENFPEGWKIISDCTL